MAMPWEEYAAQAPQQTAAEAPPWEQYGGSTPSAPAQAAPEAPQRSLSQQVARSIGLTARMPLQAAGSTVGMVGDALNSAINLGGQALGHNPNLQMPSRMIQRGIDAITPVPENPDERAQDFVGTMLAGGVRGGVDPLARGIAAKFAPTGLYDAPAAIPPSAQTVKNAQDVGYAVSPAEAQSGLFGRIMGAFAGKKGTNSLLQEHNVEATNAASRRAAQLNPHEGLTNDALDTAMQDTYKATYEPLQQIGRVPTMPQYGPEIDAARQNLKGVYENSTAQGIFDKYRNINSWDPAELQRTISQLRAEATGFFRDQKHVEATAHRAVAGALENNIEHHLADLATKPPIIGDALEGSAAIIPKDPYAVLDNFRSGRQLLAQQGLVRDAIKEGTGNADISTYGQALTNKVPLTGDLLTMGRIANQAPYSTRLPAPGSPMAQALPDIVRGGLQLGLGHLLGGAIGTGVGTVLQGGMMGTRYLMPTALGQRLFAQPAMAGTPATAQGWKNAIPTAYNLGTGLFNDQSY